MKYIKVLVVLVCVLSAITGSAEVYRWVDDQGQVHFGDKPGIGNYEVIEKEVQNELPVTDYTTPNEKTEEKKQDHADVDTTDAEDTTQEEGGVNKESARQQRISDMEALADELRIAREEREKQREKEKEELRLLREGCAKAEERVAILQKQMDYYKKSDSQGTSPINSEKLAQNAKRQRIAIELKSRQKYVNENCNNL